MNNGIVCWGVGKLGVPDAVAAALSVKLGSRRTDIKNFRRLRKSIFSKAQRDINDLRLIIIQ